MRIEEVARQRPVTDELCNALHLIRDALIVVGVEIVELERHRKVVVGLTIYFDVRTKARAQARSASYPWRRVCRQGASLHRCLKDFHPDAPSTCDFDTKRIPLAIAPRHLDHFVPAEIDVLDAHSEAVHQPQS